MDIRQIISDYHNAPEMERERIREKLRRDFSLLPENEQREVQRIFLESQNETIEEAKEALSELKLYHELERVSQYVSMSYVAQTFFGKSRQWLNNKVKGNRVNGKPDSFTRNELIQFSSALNQIGDEIKNTALRIVR
jgi:hypothetical protein